MEIFTVHGTFTTNNQLICDDGRVLKAYNYKIDFPYVFNKTGFFMLREWGQPDEYVIMQYLID